MEKYGMDAMTETPDGRVLLAKHIKANWPTQKAFADKIGCSESYLSLILSGGKGISFGLAKRISEATDGEIPIEVLPHKKAAQ